jgi:hypothetical protein
MTETKTYRMRMRIVRGAPYYDTVDAGMVDVDATNAWDAEKTAAARMMREHPVAKDAYAATRRRVRS